MRQGDLIRRDVGTPSAVEWGFVLTADCDIAQGKAGDHFTYLEVVPAEIYLEKVWAPSQSRRFTQKQSQNVLDQLNGALKRSGLDLLLTEQTMMSWLATSSPDKIEHKVNRTGKPFDAKLTSLLGAFHILLNNSGELSQLSRFVEARSVLGDRRERIEQNMREAFEGERGFPDFFLLPELPGASGYGFVVMLRAIRSVDAKQIFPDRLDARIAGHPNAFWRAGRLNDAVRFAITQKLAFLFSRIGMSSQYESECESAINLMAGALNFDGK